MSYNSDMKPPRLFNVVRAENVRYNMDFVEYMVKNEIDRRRIAEEPVLSTWELEEYKRQVIRKLIVQGDTEGAMQLRPTTTRQILQEKK